MSKLDWEHKEEWHKRGTQFLVVVKRHYNKPFRVSDGGNRWCVYAYIYPKHPLFQSFNGTDMSQSAASDLPLHCGPSFLQWYFNADGEPTSVQVGSDYNHLHDDSFTRYIAKEEASNVFRDAEKLFKHLEDLNKWRNKDGR